MGTIEAICYRNGYRNGGPPDLPLAVMVKLDHYTGPTLHYGTVLWHCAYNTPQTSSWSFIVMRSWITVMLKMACLCVWVERLSLFVEL